MRDAELFSFITPEGIFIPLPSLNLLAFATDEVSEWKECHCPNRVANNPLRCFQFDKDFHGKDRDVAYITILIPIT